MTLTTVVTSNVCDNVPASHHAPTTVQLATHVMNSAAWSAASVILLEIRSVRKTTSLAI